MNYYQIVAFAQHLKKENMNKNDNAFIDNAYEEESKLYGEFMNDIVQHDYSYMMSDDNRNYLSGRNSEKQIEEKLHALINICRYDAYDLLDRTLSAVPQRFNDIDKNGDDLTHRIIRGWFKDYVKEYEL